MQIPGIVWTAILAAIPLVVQFLSGEVFAGQAWVSGAVLILGLVARLIEVYAPKQPVTKAYKPGDRFPTRGNLSRLLFGG